MSRSSRLRPLPSWKAAPDIGRPSFPSRVAMALAPPAKSAGSPLARAVCRASASAMSLSLLVSIRSTTSDSGGEVTPARVVARPVALEGPGEVVRMPAARRKPANLPAASAAGSDTRSAGPLVESSVRPSSALRALTGARLSLTPMGCSAGPE